MCIKFHKNQSKSNEKTNEKIKVKIARRNKKKLDNDECK